MNFNNKTFIATIMIFISLALLRAHENDTRKAKIAASTFSLYDISKNIAADSAEVFMILPFGVDIHSFEPTPKQMIKILKSDLAVYSGAGLEPWINKFEFKNKTLDMSLHVKLINLNDDAHEHFHDKQHHHGGIDPHYWLDIGNMIIAAKQITKELIELSPKNKEMYIKNRDAYISMLRRLDNEYAKRLSSCRLDTIIVNHNAFSYLARRYGFKVEALSGLSPEAEPSAKNMMKLIKHVEERNISTIFFESFVSDKAIKSIAKEANVTCDVLQPLGNITENEARSGLGYRDIMKINLEKISKALECR